ncbi:MAG: NAD(P)H-hydrate epimerase [Candidatus Lokiarchaeota archaeon]|nr:NAD(P)H-hydrate epimerase [Candidatus Lokiarchaeota archaeon]
MSLPGITKEQMIEVDRIMVEDFKIPVELMMELAGLNLAILALNLSKNKYSNYIIIAGTGHNAGGGIVAARRLASWGLNSQIFLPRGRSELKNVPNIQCIRAEQLGIEIANGLPSNFLNFENDTLFIDAYLGYEFSPRQDEISNNVFNFYSSLHNLISLDIPSGLDATTGESFSDIKPVATLTLAYVKQGLLITEEKNVGELYIADIGIPINLYYKILEDQWSQHFEKASLQNLYFAFKKSPMHKVQVYKKKFRDMCYWKVD